MHTVLYDDGLKDEVFHKASEMVRIMTIPASDLKAWKDNLPE